MPRLHMRPDTCHRARRVCNRCAGALVLGGFPVLATGLQTVFYHEWGNQVALVFGLGACPVAAIYQRLLLLGLADENGVVVFLLPASQVCVALFTLRAPLLSRWLL